MHSLIVSYFPLITVNVQSTPRAFDIRSILIAIILHSPLANSIPQTPTKLTHNSKTKRTLSNIQNPFNFKFHLRSSLPKLPLKNTISTKQPLHSKLKKNLSHHTFFNHLPLHPPQNHPTQQYPKFPTKPQNPKTQKIPRKHKNTQKPSEFRLPSHSLENRRHVTG